MPKSLMKFVLAVMALAVSGISAQAQNFPDQWHSYVRERDGAVSVVLYRPDLMNFPLFKLGWTVEMSLTLQSQTENGLADRAESERLALIDTALDELEISDNVALIGRQTTKGKRIFYFFAPSDAALVAKIFPKLQELGYSRPETLVKLARESYNSDLLPTPFEERNMWDDLVLSKLEDQGDIPERARLVDHWAVFFEVTDAVAFTKVLEKNGFHIVDVGPGPRDPTMIVVHSSHIGSMEPSDIKSKTRLQFEIAQKFNGYYDGWETQVQR